MSESTDQAVTLEWSDFGSMIGHRFDEDEPFATKWSGFNVPVLEFTATASPGPGAEQLLGAVPTSSTLVRAVFFDLPGFTFRGVIYDGPVRVYSPACPVRCNRDGTVDVLLDEAEVVMVMSRG